MRNWQTPLKLIMTIFTVFLVSAATVSAGESLSEADWEFAAGLYLWGASVDGKTTRNSDVEVDFGDIFSNLQLGFMGSVSAQKGPWGFLVDVMYLDVDDMFSGPLDQRWASAEVVAWVITPVVSYRLLEDSWGNLNAVAGFRYFNGDFTLDSGLNRQDAGEAILDVIVGAGGKLLFLEDWFVRYYGDIGLGESEFTWQGVLAVGYSWSKIDASIGYRYLFWNFEDAAIIDDMSFNGPYAAVVFHF